MAGGWSGGLVHANAKAFGIDLPSSGVISINSGGSAFTKGTWTELVSATTADCAWMMVQCHSSWGSGHKFAYDIAIGASGSEQIIVPNLIPGQPGISMTTFMFPISIPAGTRLSARSSSDVASDNGKLRVTLFDDDAFSARSGGVVDTYGFQSGSNSGATVDAGATANTKGSYTQITGSLTNDIAGFFLAFSPAASSASQFDMLLDVAIGSSGSEKIIFPDFSIMIEAFGPYHHPVCTPYIAMPIRAGTRVAARCQAFTNASPDRTIGVVFYGVRQ